MLAKQVELRDQRQVVGDGDVGDREAADRDAARHEDVVGVLLFLRRPVVGVEAATSRCNAVLAHEVPPVPLQQGDTLGVREQVEVARQNDLTVLLAQEITDTPRLREPLRRDTIGSRRVG